MLKIVGIAMVSTLLFTALPTRAQDKPIVPYSDPDGPAEDNEKDDGKGFKAVGVSAGAAYPVGGEDLSGAAALYGIAVEGQTGRVHSNLEAYAGTGLGSTYNSLAMGGMTFEYTWGREVGKKRHLKGLYGAAGGGIWLEQYELSCGTEKEKLGFALGARGGYLIAPLHLSVRGLLLPISEVTKFVVSVHVGLMFQF
jgi:hypothetical protein